MEWLGWVRCCPRWYTLLANGRWQPENFSLPPLCPAQNQSPPNARRFALWQPNPVIKYIQVFGSASVWVIFGLNMLGRVYRGLGRVAILRFLIFSFTCENPQNCGVQWRNTSWLISFKVLITMSWNFQVAFAPVILAKHGFNRHANDKKKCRSLFTTSVVQIGGMLANIDLLAQWRWSKQKQYHEQHEEKK